jgi:hypothetical protein
MFMRRFVFPLLRYSGGGIGRGFRATTDVRPPPQSSPGIPGEEVREGAQWTFCWIAIVSLLASLAGCNHSTNLPPDSLLLPRFEKLTTPAALDVLRQRAQSVQNLSARCAVKLTRPDGQSVHLDALIVLAKPDRLRLRTWKMGQVVFDLTLRPDGLWVETPGDPQRAKEVIPATEGAAEFGHQFLWFSGGFFTDPDGSYSAPIALPQQSTPDTLALVRRSDAEGEIRCEIDRATTTPRRFQLLANRVTQFTVEMAGFQDFKGIIWPTYLRGTTSDGQKIEIELSDLEFNAELAPRAFEPPANAQKRPDPASALPSHIAAETRP